MEAMRIDRQVRELFAGVGEAGEPSRAAERTNDEIERAGGETAAESPVLVHNDHRIVVNYNASSRAARHRQLTRKDTERERTGAL